MRPLFAMAGLAEAGEAAALMISCGGLLVLILAAAIGFFARSRFATAAAVLWAFASTCLCVPWSALAPYQSDDPDVRYWIGQWRIIAAFWGLAAAATLAAWVRVFVLSTEAGHSDAPEPPPVETAAEPNPLVSQLVWLLALCFALLCLATFAR